ncbi:AAC(3) family N-acetyltransferase [Candidatus Woesearchaeota archaeon]|nr:AAC(3) family N-acetyltransferase [Candidatus Woesearchaeota archaeon]
MKKIFMTSQGPVYDVDILSALRNIGITAGDTIFVHSRLYVFGQLADVKTKEELADAFVDALIQSVGNGTVVMPTFTFSFCKTGIYDSEKTVSEAGLLSEVFRKRQGVIRSSHPIYSVAIWGKNKDYFLDADTTTCFGDDGIFGRVHKKGDVKILFIGIGADGLSQIHYVEELLKVPYRYMKRFLGKSNGNSVEVDFYVRDLENEAELDMKGKFVSFCEERKLLKTVPLGNHFISCMQESLVHKQMVDAMRKNPCVFLKNEYKSIVRNHPINAR